MNSLFDSMEKVDKYSSTIGSQLNTNRAKVCSPSPLADDRVGREARKCPETAKEAGVLV